MLHIPFSVSKILLLCFGGLLSCKICWHFQRLFINLWFIWQGRHYVMSRGRIVNAWWTRNLLEEAVKSYPKRTPTELWVTIEKDEESLSQNSDFRLGLNPGTFKTLAWNTTDWTRMNKYRLYFLAVYSAAYEWVDVSLYITPKCDERVTTQNLAFLSYWYRMKRMQLYF